MKETKFKQTDIGLIPEDWKIDILDKAFQFLPTNTYAREFMDEKTGDVHNIHYGDILVKYGSIVDFERDSVPYLKQSVDSGDERNYLKNGDLIIADTAEDETAGKTVEIFNLGGKKAVAGLHTFACRPKFVFAPKYLGYFTNCVFFHNQMLPYFTGTKVTSISKSSIVRISVAYPPTIEEQERIANALSQVDDLLAALDEQIEKKKLIKQGTMQQLLTGKTRLKGFDGEWETVKLGQLLDVEKGQQVNGDELNDFAGFPMMNGGATLSGYYTDYNCEADNIIISEGGNSCGFVNYMRERFWAGGHCYIVSLIRKDVILYMYNLLKYNENWIMALRVGSGLPNIQRKDLLDYDVLYCCDINEQQAIASTLSAMDDEIQTLQEERDKYVLVKQGMMQQLLTGKIRLN